MSVFANLTPGMETMLKIFMSSRLAVGVPTSSGHFIKLLPICLAREADVCDVFETVFVESHACG